MNVLPDVPVVVLVATALAAVLVMIEAALPTFGVAGTAAVALATVAVLSTGDADHPWWPLLFVVLAVVVWAVLLTLHRAHRGLHIGAALMFAGGSIGYGIAADDAGATIAAVLASIALPLAFPRLARATRRILDQPAQTGMESLIGHAGEVVASTSEPLVPGTVIVRVQGSLWNARSFAPLSPGAPVVVVGFLGTTLDVTPQPLTTR
jgi:membrane-bound ClpP family serine protease